MNNFEHRVLRIEPINTAVQRCASRSTAVQRCARKSTELIWGSKGVLVRALNLHGDQKSLARTEERWKVPQSHRALPTEGSAEHSRCTYV